MAGAEALAQLWEGPAGMSSTGLVFDAGRRTDPRPSQNGEPLYAFLNRVQSPAFRSVRALIDEWFSRYPVWAHSHLLTRLRSDRDHEFRSAFWELYLHETFWRMDWDVEVRAEGSPDFTVRTGTSEFLCEATVLGGSTEEKARQSRKNAIYDLIEKDLHSPDFFLDVDPEFVGETTPSVKRLLRDLEHWLGRLDWDAVHEVFQRGDLGDLPFHVWEESGWTITFRAIPKEASRGEPGVRPLGIIHSDAVWVSGHGLRQRLMRKAAKCGIDAPLVLAVLWDDPHPGDGDVTDALFGSRQVTVDAERQRAEWSRAADGSWGTPDAPRYTRVSGVLVAFSSWFQPWSVSRSAPRLWLNPWARRPLPSDLPWAAFRVDDGGALRSDEASVSPAELFVLPDDWPGLEGAFDRSGATLVDEGAIRGVVERIVERWNPTKVVLFGSYAYGDPTVDSDIDLLVVLPPGNGSRDQGLGILQSLDSQLPVQVVAYSVDEVAARYADHDPLVREALDRGIVLHESRR